MNALTDDELVQLRANAFEYRSPGEPDDQPSMIERTLATIAARDAAVARLETALHRLWDLHHLSEGAIEVIRAALKVA
jgi:hypothetical protein